MKQQTSATTETGIKSSNIIDFTGKTIYVGIDVHQKDYQVAKVLNGICLGNHRMESNKEKLIDHLRHHYAGATFKCVYESGAWGFTLQRTLQAAGMECIVVHAADVGTTDKERRRKTDKVDALKLAHCYASGDLKGIHVPAEDRQKDRSLIRYRRQLTGDINRSKNRLKSLLKYQGIDLPSQYAGNNWSRNFLNWVEQQAQKDDLLKNTLLLMLEQIKLLRQLLLETERKLRQMRKTKYADKAELACSVPGIGPTTAMLFLLETGDIKRFKGFDSLNDFVGLCPDTDSSGEVRKDIGITTRRHKQLRSALIEAAWQAIKSDPALMDSYQALCQRMKGTQAIIRIARKLLRRLRYVLLNDIPYQKGMVA
jgi:transposase